MRTFAVYKCRLIISTICHTFGIETYIYYRLVRFHCICLLCVLVLDIFGTGLVLACRSYGVSFVQRGICGQ